jgi:hypothetical protein
MRAVNKLGIPQIIINKRQLVITIPAKVPVISEAVKIKYATTIQKPKH